MKKVEVINARQKGITFSLLVLDPREIIKLVKFPENDTVQERQRPWKLNRVKEIAKYVSGVMNLDFSKIEKCKKKAKGIIPNCPVLNVIEKIRIIEEGGKKYVTLPDTDKEIKEYEGCVEIIDGQHRLIAFDDDYRNTSFKDNEIYEMGFCVFSNLTEEEKTEIFIVANEKAEKVDKNVLNNMMKWLGILPREEEELFKLVDKLNRESISPLIGRISIRGEKVKNGFKLLQVQRILMKSGTYDKLSGLTSEQQLKSISFYLSAWNNVYAGMFNNHLHTLGKISGLRYIFYIFPYISDILEKEKIKTGVETVSEKLKILRNNIFTDEFLNDKNGRMLNFRAETATVAIARKHGEELKNICFKESERFNPNKI